MEKSSQNGGNQLFNGDVSDNNNSVAYQTSLTSSNQMMSEKDTSKGGSDCTDTSASASGIIKCHLSVWNSFDYLKSDTSTKLI